MKSYHCFAAIGQCELLFRLSTCTCEMCQNGKYEECGRDKIHGEWKKHCINVSLVGETNDSAQAEQAEDMDDDDQVHYEDGEDDEDIYSEQVTADDGVLLEKTVQLGFAGIKQGDFIIVLLANKQYIGQIIDVSERNMVVTGKFMRRDFSYLDSEKLKFRWPAVEDFHEIKDWSITILAKVLDYSFNRRGAFLINSCIKSMFKNLN